MIFHTIVGGVLQQNAYLYGDESGLFLIDPGSHAQEWMDYLKENNLTLNGILLTHGHFDHIGAVDVLRDALGVPLYMHQADAIMLSDADWRAGKPQENYRPAEGYLSDGEHIGPFTVMHTPGHSLGSVCYLAEDRIFTGDTLFLGTIGRTDFPGGDFGTMKESLARLYTLPESLEVYPGHGEASTIGREKRQNPYLRG